MTTLARALSTLWHLVAVILRPALFVLVGLPAQVHPLLGLVPISVLVAAGMVLIFRFLSDQERIRQLRERMKGHLLGALVFSHSFRAVLGCLGRALAVNGLYLVHAFVPLLVMALPLVVLYVQLQHWYGWRPAKAGEECLVLARYRGQEAPAASLSTPGGSDWQVGPGYTFPSARAIVWAVQPTGQSNGSLIVSAGGAEVGKAVVAGGHRLVPLSPLRTDGTRVVDGFLYPLEPLLPAGSPIESIAFAYPSRRPPGEPWYTHWAAWFTGLTIVAGLVWSKVFRVTL